MSEQQAAEANKEPHFSIEKIYVKDASLEIPHAPQIFLERETPQIDMQLHTEAKPLDDGFFHVVLTSTVTAKFGDKVVFLVEASQGGVFQIREVPAEHMEPLLAIECPTILFPYLRETVSDLVNRAGFPPVVLSPINFGAMYQQQLQQRAQQGAAAN